MVTPDVILSLTFVQRSVKKNRQFELAISQIVPKNSSRWRSQVALKRHDPTFQCTKTASHTFHGPNSLSWCLCSQRVLKCPLWQNQQRFKSSTIIVMWRNVTDFLGRKLHWSLFILNILMFVRKTHSDVICWKNIFRLLMNHKILSKADKVFTPQLDK